MTNQVTIRERIADDSTRVDPHRDERPNARKGEQGLILIIKELNLRKERASD